MTCHDEACREARVWGASRIAALEAAVLDAVGHLGAASMQVIASDDAIIVGHVRDAERILTLAWRARTVRP